MDRRRSSTVMRLVLLATALFWGLGQARAQSPAQTGPFRSSENVVKMRNMTNAKRKAAAERTAARRAAAGKAANSQGEVKK